MTESPKTAPQIGRLPAGTADAFPVGTVTAPHPKLSIVALIASLLAATAGAVFTQAIHPVCLAKQHDCGKTAKIAQCCCGDSGVTQNEGTPVQSRFEIRADLSQAPAVTSDVQVATTPHALIRVHMSPPRLSHLDLPTLFASLLI